MWGLVHVVFILTFNASAQNTHRKGKLDCVPLSTLCQAVWQLSGQTDQRSLGLAHPELSPIEPPHFTCLDFEFPKS